MPWKFCPWFLFPGSLLGQNVVLNSDLRLAGRLRAQTIARANEAMDVLEFTAHYWHCQSSGMRAVPGRIPEEPHL